MKLRPERKNTDASKMREAPTDRVVIIDGMELVSRASEGRAPISPAPYMPASMIRDRARPVSLLPRRIYGYARFSTPNQRDASIDRQIEAIKAYAKSRGLVIDRIFVDHGVSGTASERAGLDELLIACAAHPGSIVVVENIDRLLRSKEEYGRILLEFGKSSTVIHDSAGQNSPLVEAVKAGMASEDRIRLLDRVAMGKIASAKAGRWICNKIPYGYRRAGPTAIEIDDETREHVLLIFKLKAQGLNYRQMSDELHARGISPPLARRWTSATLRKIVRNPIYVGWCVWKLTRPAGHS